MNNLTTIIPIDLLRRPADIIKKASNIAAAAARMGINVIFGHNHRQGYFDLKFIRECGKYNNVRISQVNHHSASINVSLLRNSAFQCVETDYITLLDVDIYPDFKLFLDCVEEIEAGRVPFQILPCLYLTKAGTHYLLNKAADTVKIKEKYFSFSRREFLHLACPSSVVVMKSDDYREIGGFNPSFHGHGYEDFDFLLRLGSRYNLVNQSADFLSDTAHRSPLFATGFRKIIGELCINALIEKKLAFHLHHFRDNKEDYYRSRKDNYQLFAQMHQARIKTDERNAASLLETFINTCRAKNIDYQRYSIYFDNKPGHLDRTDTFKRRLKLLLNL